MSENFYTSCANFCVIIIILLINGENMKVQKKKTRHLVVPTKSFIENQTKLHQESLKGFLYLPQPFDKDIQWDMPATKIIVRQCHCCMLLAADGPSVGSRGSTSCWGNNTMNNMTIIKRKSISCSRSATKAATKRLCNTFVSIFRHPCTLWII